MKDEGRPKKGGGWLACLVWLLAVAAVLVILPVAVIVVLVESGIVKFEFGFGYPNYGSTWAEIRSVGNPRFEPEWSPDGAQIVFTFGSSYRGETHVVGSDGSGLRRISDSGPSGTNAKIAFSPDISPDGSRIVYATTRHKPESGSHFRNFEIETSRLDGSGRRRLTEHGAQDVSPAWSPDGSRIAFFREVRYVREDSDRGIYTVAPDGSDERLLLPFSRPDSPGAGPAWSPDGRSLAFVIVEPSNEQGFRIYVLYTVGADGTGLTRLFASSDRLFGGITLTAWSPDGRTLAFWCLNRGEEDRWVRLYTVGADGSGPQVVWELGPQRLPSAGSLSWSPDGTKLLFSSSYRDPEVVAGRYQYSPTIVYVVNADGSGLRAVGDGGYASWSPDGSRIAMLPAYNRYSTYNKEDGDAYLSTVALDGSDLRVLARRDGEDRLKPGER